MATCPFCKSEVEPIRNPQGGRVCPLCRNTGRLVPAGTAPAVARPAATASARTAPSGATMPVPPSAPVTFRALAAPAGAAAVPQWQASSTTPGRRQNAPGAVAALVLGILAFVVPLLGLVLAVMAIVVGRKARRRVRQSGGGLRGDGVALAGVILGCLALAVGLVVVISAAVFVLVGNGAGGNGGTPTIEFSYDDAHGSATVLRVVGHVTWGDLYLYGCPSAVVHGFSHPTVQPGAASETAPVTPSDSITGCKPGESLNINHNPTMTLLVVHRFP